MIMSIKKINNMGGTQSMSGLQIIGTILGIFAIAGIAVLFVRTIPRRRKPTPESMLKLNKPQINKKSADAPSPESELISRWKTARQDALKVDAYSSYYGNKFAEIAKPIQNLLGVADSPELTNERRAKYLYDIISRIKNELGNQFIVSEPVVEPVGTKRMEYAQNLDKEKLLIEIERYESQVRDASQAFACKKILEALSNIMPTLENTTSSNMIGNEKIFAIANELREVLKSNGIFPLTDKSDAIRGNANISMWFHKTISADELKFPALFVKNGEKYDILGNFRGSI